VTAVSRRGEPSATSQRHRVSPAHPVHVLRWLRNGVLLSVAAAALLYLWVALQAGSDIASAQRTHQAIGDAKSAHQAVQDASTALGKVFLHEHVPLVGTGSEYDNQTTLAAKYLTLATLDNAAGTDGTQAIQYAEDQLAQYQQQSETAASDGGSGTPLGQQGAADAGDSKKDVLTEIAAVQADEQKAQKAQLASWALSPGAFWWALLGPVAVMLALAAATSVILARHFRRTAGPWLLASLLITALTMIIVGLLNSGDASNHATEPWVSRPVTMTACLLLLAAAAALAHRGYRPRLAEYRFDPS